MSAVWTCRAHPASKKNGIECGHVNREGENVLVGPDRRRFEVCGECGCRRKVEPTSRECIGVFARSCSTGKLCTIGHCERRAQR